MPPKDVYVPAPRFEEFESCTYEEWLDDSPSSRKKKAWIDFKNSVHDGNRHLPRRLALSHWHTMEDFQWVSQNLPNLRELDISDIQDGVIIDSAPTNIFDFYTWDRLREGIDGGFWGQIEKLWVRHWGCMALQNSIFRHPSTVDKSPDLLSFRSRREGHVAKPTGDCVCDVTTIIAACSNLKVLSVRGPTVGGGLNKAWHPKISCIEEGGHAHFCTLVEALKDLWMEASLSFEVLELHQAEIGLLLPMLSCFTTFLKKVKISFAPFLERHAAGRAEGDVSDPEFKEWPKDIGIRHSDKICGRFVRDYGRFAGMSNEEKQEKLHESLDCALRDPFKECPGADPSMSDKFHDAATMLKKTGEKSVEKNQLLKQLHFFMKFHSSGPSAHPVPALADDLVRLTECQHNARYQLTTTDSAVAYMYIPISPFAFIRPQTNIQSVEDVKTTPKDHQTIKVDLKTSIFRPNDMDSSTDAMQPLQMWTALQKMAPDFSPLWDLDSLMSIGFPMNEGINAPETTVLEAIVRGFLDLKRHKIPVRVLLGERKSGPGLYWNNKDFPLETPFKGWLQHPVTISNGHTVDGSPTTVTTSIAKLVDELVIRYPDWTGSRPPRSSRPYADPVITAEEQAVLHKQLEHEARGWQRWWHYHALKFTSLRRLDIRMPQAFDSFHSKRLALLLLGVAGDEYIDNIVDRGVWNLKSNGMEQGFNTRFIVRQWERKGGKDRMVWEKRNWEQTDEVFEGMVPHDEQWARLQITKDVDMKTILGSLEIPELNTVGNSVEVKPQAEEIDQGQSIFSPFPPVVQSIEQVPPAESTSIWQVPAAAETAGAEVEMEDADQYGEPSTSTNTAMRHRAESHFDSSRSQASAASESSPVSKATPYDEAYPTQHSSGLGPAGAPSVATMGKPKPRARSKVRGREKRKASEISGSRESSHERRSKRQASQEPDALPPMPTQRRRSKMEKELDWSLRK